MIRLIIIILTLFGGPAKAEGQQGQLEGQRSRHLQHGADEHLSEAEGVRAVHAWANASSRATAHVYLEIENTSDTEVLVRGGLTDIAGTVELIGFQNEGGELTYVELPDVRIAPGTRLVLSPNGLALGLSDLSRPLIEGDTFELEIELGDVNLGTSVEVHSPTAVQHKHAGHQH